jgi:hypothetical protein
MSGCIAVKVVLASIDMLTPPCSPNSWRVLASVSTGFLIAGCLVGCLTTRRAFMALLLVDRSCGSVGANFIRDVSRTRFGPTILYYAMILE